ncbi:hypothetical protein CJ010_16005 [Azoarcus sp. DD4]|uniref:cytochrome oxidase putative small subunit CydP n=1 Tax=Azoarcus sp. DD4 TaxID=2027405 RepID=UPI00112B03A4|nr:cytochrome oxidase putative small subunit CydP [Azoarcus sp. DD4]QDF97926.1 hypothetical protein CJ010_16005 [Azoarcus sp. DD4]
MPHLSAPRATDRRLVREILVVVLVKLALLGALWWGFVREARVPVSQGEMATQLVAPPALPAQSAQQDPVPDGARNGQ